MVLDICFSLGCGHKAGRLFSPKVAEYAELGLS